MGKYNLEPILPYTVKIMDANFIEREYPENLNKILIIKWSKDQSTNHNYGQKINLKDDNVVNTVTFIDIDAYQ